MVNDGEMICGGSGDLATPTPRVRMLSYNLFLRPPFIHNNTSDFKNERLFEFIKRIDDYDVLFLQEVFSLCNNRQATLLRLAKQKGFGHSCVATKSHWLSLRKPVDGGVLIVSRFPIEECDASVFEQAADVDAWAMKQVLYAKVRLHMGFVHCFTTHTQAEYYQDTAKQREVSLTAHFKQIKQLSQFVISKLCNDTLNYPALVAGDFNINSRPPCGGNRDPNDVSDSHHSSEYNMMMSLLQTPAKKYGIRVRDVLFEQHKVHPITYGDVSDVDGQPVERVLTHPLDLRSRLSLDYVFLYQKEESATTSMNNLLHAECSEQHHWDQHLNITATVEPFKVSGKPFTHLSDHYGIRWNLRL
jgi:endonuclease/exonuclease/phosphatase family metal-dependent hydrolase